MFDDRGYLVPKKDRTDFIRAIEYDIKENNIRSYKFVNHYLYYIALKFVASFGEKGVKDTNVYNLIKRKAYPNTDPEKIGYWEGAFASNNKTPMHHGTDRIAPRTYKINQEGLNYIEDHKHLFEK